VVPPGLVATSSPVGYRHDVTHEVLMKTAQRLSQSCLLEVSSTASDMSAADSRSLDCYGFTRLQSAERDAWKESGPGETAGRDMSPQVCADPLMALALRPFVPYSEDSFSTQGRPTVDVSGDKMPDAPVAFKSRQTKPLKLFCGWCGTRRTYPGVLQSFCGSCGNVLDDADKTGDEVASNQMAVAGMRPTMYPDTPCTTASGGAAAGCFSTNPTKPAKPSGHWSSANQAVAGFRPQTVQAPDSSIWSSAEVWPQQVLCSVERQTWASHKGASGFGFAEGLPHPGPMQQSYSVEGFRL
jgi:hypothetical protein